MVVREGVVPRGKFRLVGKKQEAVRRVAPCIFAGSPLPGNDKQGQEVPRHTFFGRDLGDILP